MTYVVVGSGPTGVNAALTLLKRGKDVQIWDVGRQEPALPASQATFAELKALLPDPHAYFLGTDFSALIPPAADRLLAYPPSRNFILRGEDALWPMRGREFNPVLSFAQGGLGAGWGANALCYDDDDLRAFPVSFADLAPAYGEAFKRVPVAGPIDDDLSAFLPGVHVSQPALQLNNHDAALFAAYQGQARSIQQRFGVRMGRARMAVVTDPARADRCRYCDRCLWGCPAGAIYNPGVSTMEECGRYPQFRYRPGRLVRNLETSHGRATGVRYVDVATGGTAHESCDTVFLAAGAIQTGAIFLRTLQSDARTMAGMMQAHATKPVMDTHVVRIPYVQLRRVGQRERADTFQFNTLIFAHIARDAGRWPRYIHGEILSLTGLLYHPLIESLPFGSRCSKDLFFRLKPGLGAATLFFPDWPEDENTLTLEPDAGSPTGDRIVIRYREASRKRELVHRVVDETRQALRRLGCAVRSSSIQYGGPGEGIHYAGTVPMDASGDPRCVDAAGRANAYENVYVADGAAFPSLPSKSITMSLIAHAIRVSTLAA